MKYYSIEMPLLFLLFFLAPLTARAQGLSDLLEIVNGLLQQTIPIIIGLALIFFLWGMVTVIRNSASKDVAEEGKNRMVWGLAALFVMVCVWGIISVLVQALNPDAINAPIIIPEVGQHIENTDNFANSSSALDK